MITTEAGRWWDGSIYDFFVYFQKPARAVNYALNFQRSLRSWRARSGEFTKTERTLSYVRMASVGIFLPTRPRLLLPLSTTDGLAGRVP